MSHFRVAIWNWPWPFPKWCWSNISNRVLSNILLTSSVVGALVYFYTTSRRPARIAHNAAKNSKSSSTHPVPAMVNLGNTCYANSLLQGLASSKAFLKWIMAIGNRITSENRQMLFLEALKRAVQDLNDSTKDQCSASDVIDALLEHRWAIPPNTEQDLYELFNVFVTTWDEELAALRQKRYSPLQKIVEIENSDPSLFPSISDKNIVRRGVVGSDSLAKGDLESVLEYGTACGIVGSSSCLDSTLKSNSHPSPGSLSFEHVKNAVADEKLLKPPCVGLLAVQLRCCKEDCSYKKIREEKFCVLSLSLPKTPDPLLTLDKLLERYFSVEYIQGASCDRCIERKREPSGGLMKKQGFCKLPPLLIFRIERVGFSSGGYVFKRTERFSFSEFIDVRDFCFFFSEQNKPKCMRGSLTNPYLRVLGGSASNAASASTSNLNTTQEQQLKQELVNSSAECFGAYASLFKYKYQLRAVSVHIGQAHSGHFITYRRGIGYQNRTSWFRTSDTDVTPVTFAEVASSEAYMLFYDRVLATLK